MRAALESMSVGSPRLHPSLLPQQSQHAPSHNCREALKDMDMDELNTALQHLPRHTLEGVFLAFCHWQAGTHKWPFDSLLMIASDLERQMTEAALKALAPESSWADWLELVQQASADPVVGQQLAQTFAQSMLSGPAQGAKRKLFD